LHCDATQAVGKIAVDVDALQVDLMSFTAHKIYGPKGIGALYVRRRQPLVRLEPQIAGGGHQRGLRSGTLNTPGVIGFALAIELCLAEMAEEQSRLAALRDRLYAGLKESLSGVERCGPDLALRYPDGTPLRLPGNLVLSFGLVDGEALLLSMGGLALSSGAACSSADPKPSHVLRALGISLDRTRSSLRFGLGRFNTAADIDYAISAVTESVERLRKMSSLTT
jgi:cysteine desulfurase